MLRHAPFAKATVAFQRSRPALLRGAPCGREGGAIVCAEMSRCGSAGDAATGIKNCPKPRPDGIELMKGAGGKGCFRPKADTTVSGYNPTRQHQISSLRELNRSTHSGSRWLKNEVAFVSSALIASISSSLSAKSNTEKFWMIRSFFTDFGITTMFLWTCQRRMT